ncbi:MAG: hypothetical protein ACREB3_04920, partial [Burkholderiales bacterium]
MNPDIPLINLSVCPDQRRISPPAWARRWLMGIVMASVLVPPAAATIVPVIDFVFLSKVAYFTQTGSGTTFFNEVRFEANVSGSNLGGITAPSFVVSGGNFNGVTMTLVYEASSGHWGFQSANSYPFFFGAGSVTSDFGAGTYNFTVNGSTYTTLGFPSSGNFGPNTPIATASAGIWTGGSLQVDPASALTLTTNVFSDANPGPGFFLSGQSIIAMSVRGPGLDQFIASVPGFNGIEANLDV